MEDDINAITGAHCVCWNVIVGLHHHQYSKIPKRVMEQFNSLTIIQNTNSSLSNMYIILGDCAELNLGWQVPPVYSQNI